MDINIGPTDRVVRIIAGLVLIVLALVPGLPLAGHTTLQWVAGIAGVVLVATALVRICPIYRLLGLSTCKLPRK